MLDSQLAKLKEWFSIYITRFNNLECVLNQAIEHKIHHTALVCDNLKVIIANLDWPSTDQFTAEATGLFHDLGRLSQLSEFGTMNDYASVDHGSLGEEILLEEKVLLDCPGRDQRIILSTVKWHNKYSVPEELPKDEKKFINLLRDADKLDILRIFTEYYQTAAENPNPFWEFGLAAADDCSEKIAQSILEDRLPNIKDIQNLNDLRLIKLGWIYDLNYPESKKIFKGRNFIGQTAGALPDTPRIRKAIEHLQAHLENI